MPPEGPEAESQREVRKLADQEWQNCLAVITSNTPLDPINMELVTKNEDGTTDVMNEEAIFKETITTIESKYDIFRHSDL